MTHCSRKYDDDIIADDQAKSIKRTKVQQLEFIKDVLGGEDLDFEYDRVIIVIHSLDGKALRSTDIQQTLSEIASLKKVIKCRSIQKIGYNDCIN